MGKTQLCSLLVVFSVGACHASVNAQAKMNMQSETESAADIEQTPPAVEGAPKASAQSDLLPRSDAPPHDEPALLGARHDLSLVGEHANAVCRCVKVGVGEPSSAAFQWLGSAPTLDADTELVVALSSEGIQCNGQPKGALGASYWGYRIVGDDVVVFVEGARPGRPKTSGAIIPKPAGNGGVYVAPASRGLPYGRPLEGKGNRCDVGHPANPRKTPFTAAELGSDESAAAPLDSAAPPPSP